MIPLIHILCKHVGNSSGTNMYPHLLAIYVGRLCRLLSGKLLHNHGKSPCLVGKSTI